MLVVDAVRALWRPLLAILAIMATTSCASELGVFARLAAAIGFSFAFNLPLGRTHALSRRRWTMATSGRTPWRTTMPPAAKIGLCVDFPMVAFITDSMAFVASLAINVPCPDVQQTRAPQPSKPSRR